MQLGRSFVEVVGVVEALVVVVLAPLGLHEATAVCEVELLQLYLSVALGRELILRVLATSVLGFLERERAHVRMLVVINLLIGCVLLIRNRRSAQKRKSSLPTSKQKITCVYSYTPKKNGSGPKESSWPRECFTLPCSSSFQLRLNSQLP